MTRKALIAAIKQLIFNNVWILNVSEDYSTIPHFQKALKRLLKVIDCTQQLQVRENVMGCEKALGAVKVIKDQNQYRSQSLLNLAGGYFRKANAVLALSNQESDKRGR